ncbi:MAG TPA: metal ABC transporter substrate-binding protein [Candidatus Limnocylindrales bacterium]|nr:metal ABC transporter substrate-binding protein [Candidatus Limnocylindrales bacterium]
MKATALAIAAIVLMAAGCSGTADPSAEKRLEVVATTTFLADLVRQAGAGRVDVSSIVPAGGEVHTFDPSPGDAARVAAADLIVSNGLGLDDWLTDLASDAGSTARIVRVGEGLPDGTYIGSRGGETVNPHLWLDPELAILYVERIADVLTVADPAGGAAYHEAVSDARTRFTELDRWATGRFAALPPDARRLVSFHDALPYLARAYDLEIVGVVVSAPGQEPSAGEVADLIDEIRRTAVPAIVSEVQFSDDLAATIAAETGATIVSDLYTDTLGDQPVDTYDGMIRWDVERLAAALGGS